MKKFIFSLVLLILIAVVLGSCGKQATKVSEVSRESVEPEIPKVEKSKAPAAPEPIQEKLRPKLRLISGMSILILTSMNCVLMPEIYSQVMHKCLKKIRTSS